MLTGSTGIDLCVLLLGTIVAAACWARAFKV